MAETPPFRADHVGSLLRPPELLNARFDRAAGRIDATALRAVEDKAILEGIKLQEEAGLQAITDGEMRRGSWHMDFLYQIGGVKKIEENVVVKFKSEQGEVEFTPTALRVDGKLKLSRTIFGDDFEFVRENTRRTPKLTIPSPSMMHYRGGRAAIDEKVYPEMDAFWSDLAKVYAAEIASLGRLGCTYLQIDDTTLSYMNDPKQQAYIASIGGDPKTQHLTYVKTLNDALKGRPAGLTVATHTCRGNFRSSWAAAGGYDHVAEAVFGGLDVDGYFLEFDDDRSGTFEPLRFVPKGKKKVVLGLVTTKKGALESKDALKRRIDQAARFVPLEQLCLSPQCGFSSTVDGNAVTVEDERAKLRLVVETAHEVWGTA